MANRPTNPFAKDLTNNLFLKIPMKKILISILFASTVSPLFAQSAFEGFYGQVATGYESNSYTSINQSIVGGGTTWTGNASNKSTSGAPLVLGVGYNYGLSKEFLLGIGFDYSALSQSTGNFSYATINNNFGNTFTTYNQSFKVSNRINLYITPGYALSKDTLAYLKAGYSMQQLEFSQGADPINRIESGFISTKNINGFVLGLGYKQMIANGFYGFAEANYMSYEKTSINGTFRSGGNLSDTSNPSLSAYNLLVGVGYKF